MYFTKMNCNQVEVLFFEAPSKNRPIIYTLHNGGLMFGSALTDAMMCHRLRNELDLNVVGIEYSLTTSAYYPTQLNEIETVMNYFYEHQEDLGIDASKTILIGNDAGANLACTTALKGSKSKIMLQVLMDPLLDFTTDPYTREVTRGSIQPKFIDHFRNKYSPNQDFNNPLISSYAMTQEDLEKMPPTILVMAQHDNLNDTNLNFANRLSKAYVDVHIRISKNRERGFMAKYFSASRVIYTRYHEEQIFIWIKNHIDYYLNRPF